MRRLLAVLVILNFLPFAEAGSQAAQPSTFAPDAIASFSKNVERELAERGAYVAILARQGRPPEEMPQGITFTHTAIAIYSDIALSDGSKAKGYAIHNLYQKPQNLDISELVTDYPVDFFWGAHALKAGIIIPSHELQIAILTLFHNDQVAGLHNPAYSVIANPFNSTYQNCTEYTLDIINAAIYGTTDKARLKANAQAYFSPEKVHMSRFKLALGGMFADGVSVSDHGRTISTTTFTTIGAYLSQYGLAEAVYMLDDSGQKISLLKG
ncbi:DUF2145 domain-containing protein [Alteromonas sp. H39]|uniref:DUF2145 domain-containing protein n=1 Tax=Alteromonas sp. H39 TaxID=3389876 RepID=UPI0039DF3B41